MPDTDKTDGAFGRFGSLAFAFVTLAALSACNQHETVLAVSAAATTRAAPDLAIVTLGVAARGVSARAAQEAQSARMDGVLQAAHAAGAQNADVQTVGFSLEPQYAYARGQAPRITGYVSRNTVAIRLRNLNGVSALIDSTVAQGANELQGVQFSFQDEEASRDLARAQALQTARRRAERYAQAAGLRVSRIRSIVEPGSSLPLDLRRDGYGPRLVAVEQAADNRSHINAGELDNQASVTVVFELR